MREDVLDAFGVKKYLVSVNSLRGLDCNTEVLQCSEGSRDKIVARRGRQRARRRGSGGGFGAGGGEAVRAAGRTVLSDITNGPSLVQTGIMKWKKMDAGAGSD